MARRFGLAAFAAVVLGAAAMSNAALLTYTANLSGPNESPANASPGTGFAQVDIDTSLHTMRVQVTFSGLTGTTTASHIHAATAVALTGTAGVATTTPTFSGFPLGVTSGSYDNTLDLTQASSYNPSYVTGNGGTTAGAEAALLAAFANGEAYLNVHTNLYPGGEIRGFLVPAPEPGTVGLLAGAGLIALRRRRDFNDFLAHRVAGNDRLVLRIAEIGREAEQHTLGDRRQRLVRQQQCGVGIDQHQRYAAQLRHHPAGHCDVTAHAEHHVRLAATDDAEAGGESADHLEHAAHGMRETLAAQAGEVDRVHLDTMLRHDIALHAVLRAEPGHLPAACLHGLRDGESGEDVSAGTGCHDEKTLHTRPPRISTRFS